MSQTQSQDKECKTPLQRLNRWNLSFPKATTLDLWGSSDTTNHSIRSEEESYGRLVSQKFLQISSPQKEKTRKRKPSNLQAGNHFGFFKAGKGDGNNSKWALVPCLHTVPVKCNQDVLSEGQPHFRLDQCALVCAQAITQ